MNQKKINSLILKLINDTISEQESEQLVKLLNDDNNLEYFKEYIQINLLINRSLKNQFESKKAFLRLRFRQVFSQNRLFKYAAILVLIFGLLNYLISPNNELKLNSIDPKTNITLNLGDKVLKVLEFYSLPEKIKVSNNINIEISGKSISYESFNNLEFEGDHIIHVPNGKKFELLLSDSTKIYLNSGSKIKYPPNFVSGKNREIFLLNGEAYFDIAKSKDQKFIVKTKYYDIEVLGTKFNISTYEDDEFSETVLLEGSVNFSTNNDEFNNKTTTQLIPGQKVSINKERKNIVIENVDTEIYKGWINNKLIFRNISFNEMTKKLERNYNVKIINNNQGLGEQFFSATFENESIYRVMELFKRFYEIEYTINENIITIN